MSIAATDSFARRATRRLFLLMTVVLCLSSLAIAYATLNEFNRLLIPELSKKAQLIGQIVSADVQRAIDYGIPFDEFVGASEHLEAVVADHNELVYIAVVDRNGSLLYQGGTLDKRFEEVLGKPRLAQGVSGSAEAEAIGDPPTPTELPDVLDYGFPVFGNTGLLGFVDIGIDRHFVQRQLNEIVYDLVVIVIVALLVAIEVMLALILISISGPIERLNLLMGLHAQGDFSKQLITRARDPVGQMGRYLSDGGKRIHERYQSLRNRVGSLVEGQREAVRDADTAARLEDIGARFRLVGGLTPLVQASANDIRIPLFIFAFAEELQKSFLPLYVRSVYEPIPWLSESVVIGLPIVMYLAVLAVAQPFAGVWSDRYGTRKIFLFGLVPAVAGFIGCAFATTVYELMVWRGTTALGYGVVTITCQSYVFGVETPGARARNVAIFVAVIMSATMCGTAIGGILADRIGYRPVFWVAAALAIAAGVMAQRILTHEMGPTAVAPGTSTGGVDTIRTVLRNAPFVVFLLCVAIPANVLVAAFLWYIVPLYLSDLGATTAEIGRVLMIYYLVVFAGGQLASRFVDQFGGLAWVVGLGSLLSGAGLVAFYDWHSIWAVVLAVIIMAVSHALIKAPQFALTLEICEREIALVGRTTVLNFLRVAERVGMMLGLLFSAFLIEVYGFRATIGITGTMVCGAAMLFLLFYLMARKGRMTTA